MRNKIVIYLFWYVVRAAMFVEEVCKGIRMAWYMAPFVGIPTHIIEERALRRRAKIRLVK